MPRVPLTDENKSTNPFDYPKLSLKYGDRARILLIERDPLLEFTHTLEAIRVVDGQVVHETKKNRNGDDIQVPRRDFITRLICPGRHEVIADKGIDPDQCPVCKASAETDAVLPPERRFALHVIRYKLKPGGFEVQEPFSVECIAWAFRSKMFDQLVNFTSEWKDMLRHDLKLGPCENEQFQKWDIAVAGEAAWLADATFEDNGKVKKLGPRGELVQRTYKENQADDLSVFIGRQQKTERIREDLEKVVRKYQQAYGAPKDTHPETMEEVAASVDVDELLAPELQITEPEEEKKPSGPEKSVAKAVAKSESPGEDAEFEDLLAGLGE